MRVFGLIGYPLEHSFSERWFNELFRRENIVDAVYHNFPIPDISLLPRLLADNPDIAGFNVTSPYKEAIIPYLDELSPEAEEIGAVNCVVRRGGRLCGHNTDWQGFYGSLEKFLEDSGVANSTQGGCLEMLQADGLRALVLGSGGAAKAVKYALGTMSISCIMVSRREMADCIRYEDLTPETVAAHRLIINATPLGMYPDTMSLPPFPYGMLSPRHCLYDLVYNPPMTAFLEQGVKAGASVNNGYEMLILQAKKSMELFQI